MGYYDGILLGLSTGSVCLAYCGPVLIPYMLGENNTISRNYLDVSLFLAGRLAAYIAIGFITGVLGKFLLQPSPLSSMITGISYIVLSLLLILYGFYQFKEVCLGRSKSRMDSASGKNKTILVPLTGGILTGLNICPPFVLAIAKAAALHNITKSTVFFILFFAGTSVFFIPLPFLGFFKRQQVLRTIGKFAAILSGVVYLYKGIMITFN